MDSPCTHKKTLSGFLHDDNGCKYVGSEYIRCQHVVKNGFDVWLENGCTYFCRGPA